MAPALAAIRLYQARLGIGQRRVSGKQAEEAKVDQFNFYHLAGEVACTVAPWR